MHSIEEKIDNATHAALTALGLVAETYPDIADSINDMLHEISSPYITNDCEDE